MVTCLTGLRRDDCCDAVVVGKFVCCGTANAFVGELQRAAAATGGVAVSASGSKPVLKDIGCVA